MTVLSVEEAQPKQSADSARPDRVLGLLKGKLEVPDSFFDPLPEEELWV